ncbi:MAG: glycosyltransferase [Actinobacteria bacterium]|nr:glycosyltransferase [Actinomycetota bacterium]
MPEWDPVKLDGKFFCVNGRRLHFRGVTYGTFRPRESDDARFPERDGLKRDLSAMNEAGFTVVRTYTEPTADLLDVAADWDLRVLAGVFWPDWRYLLGSSRRQATRTRRDARREVGMAARRLADDPRVLALCIGNEIPADVIRWHGAGRVARVIAELADVVRQEDPDRLVTYGNYPTAEYLDTKSLDFLTFNIFLERPQDLRIYLTRLHHLAGDRPVVIGELGGPAGPGAAGEQSQAEALDWQLEVALERGVAGSFAFSWTDEWWVGDAAVEGWRFGLTRSDRSPRPALDVAARWNGRTVSDLRTDWPSVSVVICAYNAAATLDECLAHTCALDYPDLEILVVDDGSTDATAAIARAHPRARLVEVPHAGLGTARNVGLRAATGELIAYLDSDAYPDQAWPYYLVLGLDGRNVAGVGGPNLPPGDDPVGAQVVARSPGGPVHVLITDDRAEHVPGCNMAFWRYALEAVAGCDPIYTSAGDDVDLCWKVLDRGWEIGFHPAALVWHHRRPGLRTYLRQQRGYGRAESLVEARHPDRFTAVGSARWRGRIYNSLLSPGGRQRIYRGQFGVAAYQSVYRSGGHGLDLAHQVGVPAAAIALAAGPVALFEPRLASVAALALAFLAVLGAVDVARARPPHSLRTGRMRFRLSVAAHHLLQPLVRWWSRHRSVASALRQLPVAVTLDGPATRQPGGSLRLPEAIPRAEIVVAILAALRRHGIRAVPASEWDDHDARIRGSWLVEGRLISSSHPVGWVQVDVRRRVMLRRLGVALAVVATAAALAAPLAGALGALALAQLAVGWWRTGPLVRRILQRVAR